MKKHYACSFCGKENVKLWHGSVNEEYLICAVCAEKRQTQEMEDEIIWKITSHGRTGRYTGRQVPLPKWTINENGERRPIPAGGENFTHYSLTIDLTDIGYSSCKVVVPAIPKEDGNYWSWYSSAPEEDFKWWRELPTR